MAEWDEEIERGSLLTFPYALKFVPGGPTDERQVDDDPGVPPDVDRKRRVRLPTGEGYLAGRGTPGMAPTPSPAYAIGAPWIDPPLAAYMIDLPLNRIPQVIAPGGSLALVTWPAIPQGYMAVVKKIGYTLTGGALANSRVTTRRNQTPVQPFPGVVGAIGTLEAPADVQIVLGAGDVFDVLVTNTGAAAITVAVRASGWWWRQ